MQDWLENKMINIRIAAIKRPGRETSFFRSSNTSYSYET